MIPLLALAAAFTCQVQAVHDGDTFRCADNTRIRLQGIDANELNGSCHVSCAALSATEARDALSRLALGRTVSCVPTGTSYRRVTAWCSIRGTDLSCEMVRSGAAVVWRRYDPAGRLLTCGQR